MMRWLLLAVAVVLLSGAATFLVQVWQQHAPRSEGPAYPNAPVADEGPPATAVVDGNLTHDFGAMAQFSKDSHKWKLTNKGPGKLTLIRGEKSCSCTVANMDNEGDSAVLAPGESTNVTLSWDTKGNNGHFSQYAEILTPNDPERHAIRFIIQGNVAPAVVLYPQRDMLSFSNISNEESHKASLALYSPDRPQVKVTSLKTSKPQWITAKATPLTKDEQEELRVAKGGYRIEVTTKPGMPLGEMLEELVIETDHPKQPKLRVTLTGKVLGPISLMPERVRFTVGSSQGGREAITLWVRGRENTHIDVEKAPADLKVEIAAVEPKTKASQDVKARRYLLTVTVPPGVPPKEIDGSIILKTDHPFANELYIPVMVRVEAAG